MKNKKVMNYHLTQNNKKFKNEKLKNLSHLYNYKYKINRDNYYNFGPYMLQRKN